MKINLPKLGFLALIISSFNSFAQKNNTSGIEQEVLRMTFESKNYEVYELGEIDLLENGVSSPTDIKADLFTSFGGGYDVGIPSNIYGFEDHIEDDAGSKYIGLVLYKPGKSAAERSYVTIPISNEKNSKGLAKLKYCVEFSISLSESSKFAVNNISVLFSEKIPSPDPSDLNIITGAIYNSSNSILKGQGNKVYSGFYGWEKVCNIYTAKGNEKFITIGNFDKNESTKFEAVKKPIDSEAELLSHAYYYIDNVIITQIDNEEQCKCYNTAPERIEDSFSNLIYSKTPEITDKMKPAEKIAAQVAYFRFGKATFTENCKEAMNFVINEMKTNKGSIEIQGHCDAKEIKVGEENDEYSEMDKKRMNAVVKYFVEQGIDRTLITPTYKSATIPSAEIEEDDEDEVKDAKNRRINFILK